MKRVMLRVAYDGTEYCGWQVQPNGITIEGVLNRELSDLLKTPIEVIGASRTDSGVHSNGNVCVFDTESRIPGEKFAYALNAKLPEDIVIQESREVAADFHPRHCECNKTYEYRIYNATFPNPSVRRYSHFIYRNLDVEKMREAAAYLVGEHDFKSFCSVNTQVKETVRTVNWLEIEEEKIRSGKRNVEAKGNEQIYESQLEDLNGKASAGGMDQMQEPKMITIRINGNGFLYNMVRIIAGTLIEVGYGWREPESMKEALEALDRQATGQTAPACGLTLMGIFYDEKLLEITSGDENQEKD